VPTDVSLAIGENEIAAVNLKGGRENPNEPPKRFPRTAVLTADVMSKSGAARAGTKSIIISRFFLY